MPSLPELYSLYMDSLCVLYCSFQPTITFTPIWTSIQHRLYIRFKLFTFKMIISKSSLKAFILPANTLNIMMHQVWKQGTNILKISTRLAFFMVYMVLETKKYSLQISKNSTSPGFTVFSCFGCRASAVHILKSVMWYALKAVFIVR